MSKYTEISFQYYPARVNSNEPLGIISLERFLISTKTPKNSTKAIFDQIADAELSGDKKLKDELKQNHLFYFTPCVYVHPFRRYDCIKHFTGLLVLDFDHIDNARDFKYFLFDEYKCIITAYISPSKRGVKCLVKIPVINANRPWEELVAKFKEYYFGIAAEMEPYNGFCESTQSSVLPLFQSYDPELLSRNDPDTWATKGTKRGNFSTTPTLCKPVIDVTYKEKETLIKIIDRGFRNITDYGHPPLRSLCLSIGGYVASGYIPEHEALQMIYYEIENHSYLRKGIRGYKTTAQWAIRAGQSKPLTLNNRCNG
ncbi:MAG: BT4734/BF3469 family protein [Bacteroidota bacterium]